MPLIPCRYLFRSMVTNESIVELNRDKLPTTNLFTFIEFKSGKESLEENFSFIPTKQPRQTPCTTNTRQRRARCVTININSKLPTTADNYQSCTTPFPKIPSRPYGHDSLNPMSMEMCTPISTAPAARGTSLAVTSTSVVTNNNNVLLSTNVNGKRLRKLSGNLEQQQSSSTSLEIKNGIIR